MPTHIHLRCIYGCLKPIPTTSTRALCNDNGFVCLLAAHQRLSKSVICWCFKWIWLARWRGGDYRRNFHLINAEAKQHNQPNSKCISILLLLLLLRCRSREFIVTAISPAEDKCFNEKLRCEWMGTDSIQFVFYSIKVRLQTYGWEQWPQGP